jgi:hypothetical protein
MLKEYINNLSGEALFFTTVGLSMLCPYSTPIWLSIAMIITCCKSPNFLEEEFSRRESVRLLYEELEDEELEDEELEDEELEDEELEDEELEDEELEDLTINELQQKIKDLNDEIAEYKCETSETIDSNLTDLNTKKDD